MTGRGPLNRAIHQRNTREVWRLYKRAMQCRNPIPTSEQGLRICRLRLESEREAVDYLLSVRPPCGLGFRRVDFIASVGIPDPASDLEER